MVWNGHIHGLARHHLERADLHRSVQLQAMHPGEAELAHHVEQLVEDAVDMERRGALQQVQALERAVVVVEVRNEHRVEAFAADPFVVESHVGEGMAVAAERVLENGIERDARAATLEHIARVQNSRNRQACCSHVCLAGRRHFTTWGRRCARGACEADGGESSGRTDVA
jgi:hypothetical protein